MWILGTLCKRVGSPRLSSFVDDSMQSGLFHEAQPSDEFCVLGQRSEIILQQRHLWWERTMKVRGAFLGGGGEDVVRNARNQSGNNHGHG
jgi:hypothetical protein